MISAEFDRPHLYAYVGGMVNQAWLAGIAGEIETKANPVRFKLFQNANPNLALPVELKAGDYMPSIVRDGIAIKVEGHIFGRKLASGERCAVFQAIKVTPPTLLDMPGELAWKGSIDGLTARKWPEGVPQSPVAPEFQDPSEAEADEMARQVASASSETKFTGPRQMTNLFQLAAGEDANDPALFRDRLKLRQASNVVRIAGIVEGAFMAMDMNGREQNDTLIVLLRQNTDSDRCIPVRVYNRQARTYHGLVKVGTPVLVLGAYRQRVKVVSKADTPGTADVVNCFPYIHTNHIRVATAQEIKFVPPWAEELARKMSAAARFQPGRRDHGVEAGDEAQPSPRRRALPETPPVDEGGAANDSSQAKSVDQDFKNLAMADDD